MSICTFKKEKGCTVLNRDTCKGCTFFKTEKQLEEGRKKARKRIESLPDDVKKHIKNKYYQNEPKGKGAIG